MKLFLIKNIWNYLNILILLLFLLILLLLIIVIVWLFSLLRVFAYQPTVDTRSQSEVKIHPAIIRVICCQHAEYPSLFDALDQHYCYKSVDTQIPHVSLLTQGRELNPVPMRARHCMLVKKIKSVAYSSQGSHTGQLVFCNWLADDSRTG